MATNMYLKFESPSIGEMEVLSWSQQIGDRTRRTDIGNALIFSKYFDAKTTELLKFCWSGKQIGKATLRCFRASGADGDKPVEYLVIVMQHVLIANYSVSGGPGDLPVDNVTLEYGTISYEFKDHKLMGAEPATATFDVEKGTAG